jgi:hypothetical protein
MESYASAPERPASAALLAAHRGVQAKVGIPAARGPERAGNAPDVDEPAVVHHGVLLGLQPVEVPGDDLLAGPEVGLHAHEERDPGPHERVGVGVGVVSGVEYREPGVDAGVSTLFGTLF